MNRQAKKEVLWDQGVGSTGLKFFHSWLTKAESHSLLENLNDNATFPWNIKPRLYGTSLPQHAYMYNRPQKKSPVPSGLQALETLCHRVETDFACTVSGVYCNRFQDPHHHIQWHQDQYASHIFVLSLGAPRGIEFRPINQKKSNLQEEAVTRYDPKSGDLYFMSLQHNTVSHHRVLSQVESGFYDENGDDVATTRISLVFFVSAPFDKPEYKIGWGSRLKGAMNGLLS